MLWADDCCSEDVFPVPEEGVPRQGREDFWAGGREKRSWGSRQVLEGNWTWGPKLGLRGGLGWGEVLGVRGGGGWGSLVLRDEGAENRVPSPFPLSQSPCPRCR